MNADDESSFFKKAITCNTLRVVNGCFNLKDNSNNNYSFFIIARIKAVQIQRSTRLEVLM